MTPLAFEIEASDASKGAKVVRRLSSHFPRPLRRGARRPASSERYVEDVCTCGCMSELLHSDSGRDDERRGGGVPLEWTIKREEGVGSITLLSSLHYLASPFYLSQSSREQETRDSGGARVRGWMRQETPAANGVD